MQKSSGSSKKRVLFLLVLAAVLLAAAVLALSSTRSRALLDHTTDALPGGSVWLSTSFPLVERYYTEGRASEAPLSDSEVREFLRLVQEGWTGEVLPFGRMADGGGLLRVWFCEGQVDDPRARGIIPQVSFMLYDRKTIENLQNMAAHTGVDDLADLPYGYGLFVYWVPTDGSFDFESVDCAAFYPLTAEGWQVLADWMDAKLAAAGLALSSTRSRALLDHTTDVLPDGSVWLQTSAFSVASYRRAGLASEVQLTPSEVEEFLCLVQEGWTGEVLPRSRRDGFDGFAPMSVWFCEGEVTDPRAAGFIPPISFLIYSNEVMDLLQPTLDAILPSGFEAYPYTYGVYANWVPTTNEAFDFEDPACTAFYPMTAEGWQALADWMDAKLAAAGASS